jgi:alkanesulfonate monooxygenase SsuD/methylene tetrahydromethanopterin reductase-like flavin-dependent oxidoreductase (luciferase family)
MGALSAYTRTPALIAMTVSALDEMAPERIILGMGTALPLRLAQLGIPYTPDKGVEEVSKAIDTIRAMWAGQRIPSATPNLPPVQPMFPPVHRVPIYIAAYRTAFLELAGQKADGYLARPAESIPNMQRLVAKLRKASVQAGRDENAVNIAGYLLTHVDKSRRDALNRAKREPFVIYMMSVLSNFSMQQAGFEPELRDRIAAAWRAEDYHKAAEMIPDSMLDAFMLVGTPEEVAEGAEMPAGGHAVRLHDRHCRKHSPGRSSRSCFARFWRRPPVPAGARLALPGCAGRNHPPVQPDSLIHPACRRRRAGLSGWRLQCPAVHPLHPRFRPAAGWHQHHQRNI